MKSVGRDYGSASHAAAVPAVVVLVAAVCSVLALALVAFWFGPRLALLLGFGGLFVLRSVIEEYWRAEAARAQAAMIRRRA